MKLHLPSRLTPSAALMVLLAVSPAYAGRREPGSPPPAVKQNRMEQRAEQRQEQRSVNRPQANIPNRQEPNAAARQAENQHLERWMENHKNLSLQDNLQALENEPGFKVLPPETQQRYRNALTRLYNMSPEQRSRMLNGVEGLEHLTPQQQQRWNEAVQQARSAPPQRRSLMLHAYADLKEMPPDQREEVINSPAFAAQFSDSERSTIRTLLTAAPYVPAQ